MTENKPNEGDMPKFKTHLCTGFIALISSIIGGLIVASINHHYSLQAQDRKLWAELRTQAYIELIESTKREADDAYLKKDDVRRKEVRTRRDLALFKIAMYGSKSVNEAVKDYQQNGGVWEVKSIKLFQTIRQDLLPENEMIADDVIKNILFPPSSNNLKAGKAN